MVPFGGPGVMLLAILVAGFVVLVLTLAVGRRLGWGRAVLLGLFGWSLVSIFVVTLVPANGPTSYIPVGQAQTSCSFDYGGPAPSRFWIFGGGQRLLNTLVFMPAAIFWALAMSRFRRGLRWVLPGAVLLAGCSVLIELTQLELTRIGRACDITDVVDNVSGVVLGTLLGVLVGGLVRLAVGPRARSG